MIIIASLKLNNNDYIPEIIAKYLGKTDPISLINGKLYEVISIERDWFRIIDETGEDYLYPPELFEIVRKR